MGQLRYGTPPEVFEFDDRTLAHIEVVVLSKLRRGEGFAISAIDDGGGRSAIWVSPASTIRFDYGVAAHDINRAWLEELMEAANSPAGLRITPEP